MAETESGRSPLARLVLLMLCLALLGSIVAAAHYYAIDLPHQKSVPPPENELRSACNICYSNCAFALDKYNCYTECDLIC